MVEMTTTDDGRIEVERTQLSEEDAWDVCEQARQTIREKGRDAVDVTTNGCDLSLDVVTDFLGRNPAALDYAHEHAGGTRVIEFNETLYHEDAPNTFFTVHIETIPDTNTPECITVETRQ